MMKKYGVDLVRKLCLLLEVPRSSNAVTDHLFLRDTKIHDVDLDLEDFSNSERQYKFRNWHNRQACWRRSFKAIHYPYFLLRIGRVSVAARSCLRGPTGA